jgi:predicted methyltransferase
MKTLKLKTSLAGLGLGVAMVLGGCAVTGEVDATKSVEVEMQKVDMAANAAALAAVLAAQPDEVQARYDARTPAATIAFFGIEPGMTVAEALPGGGWYSKILMPYLGTEGTFAGAHYPDDLWSRFGFGEEWAANRVESTAKWPEQVTEWGVENSPAVASYKLTEMPAELEGTMDAVLFIRALHNLNRFNADAGYMDDTLAEAFKALKPGGIVGVVQHRAPEANGDDWASGANGYLKQSAVIAAFESAGFELVESSELNANAKDMPTEDDFVWRLPPGLNGTEEGSTERDAVVAIGESDRMTLKFKKPA